MSKYIPLTEIGQHIQQIRQMVQFQRKGFERKWYDNNFFDDGYHFKYVSRVTGKIIDSTDNATLNMPQRAIPKASRQIRGVANLLLSPEYTPTVYPKRVYRDAGMTPEMYQAQMAAARDSAKRKGLWLTSEWKEQHLKEKLIHMAMLSAKNSVSYLEIWLDKQKNAIKTEVYDAFDIVLNGYLTNIYDCPFIGKAIPQTIQSIKANQLFDKDQIALINPDNKYASSEIKEAYLRTRFGTIKETEQSESVILNEFFFKDYLDEELGNIIASTKDADALRNKKVGDCIIRHTFSCGGLWLYDEYTDLYEYPFVDFRYEPGPIYQKALIENFIPQNKSLDILVSRVEKWANTMVTGTWLKRKGENFEISNISGGQVLEYTTTPPVQANMANVPPGMFNLMDLLEKYIEEQGASTSALGVLPTGVRSGTAIESVKATEYANLKIASDQLKQTVKCISQQLLRIASTYVDPQAVYAKEYKDGEFFDVIGQDGLEARQRLGLPIPAGVVPIEKDDNVEIEIESGMGYTEEGKKETVKQMMDFLLQLAGMNLLPADSLKVAIQKFFDIYKFGATQEFMEAFDNGTTDMNANQIMQLKVALAEVLKETGAVGPEHDSTLVNSTKVGVVEALKDTGMLDKQSEGASAKSPSESISFKDLPPEGKAQMAAQAGINITPNQVNSMEEQNAVKGGQQSENN